MKFFANGRRRKSQIEGIERTITSCVFIEDIQIVAEGNPRLRELKGAPTYLGLYMTAQVAEGNPRLRELKGVADDLGDVVQC